MVTAAALASHLLLGVIFSESGGHSEARAASTQSSSLWKRRIWKKEEDERMEDAEDEEEHGLRKDRLPADYRPSPAKLEFQDFGEHNFRRQDDVGIGQVPPQLSPDCTTITDCISCYNVSYWCHWCTVSSSEEEDEITSDLVKLPSNTTTSLPAIIEPVKKCLSRSSIITCIRGESCEPQDTCSSRKTCDECQNSSVCHWCADHKCHTIGSFYGCTVGVSCYSNDQCIRKEPEFRGYGPIPSWVGIFCVLAGTSVCLCGSCIQCLCFRVKCIISSSAQAERLGEYQLHPMGSGTRGRRRREISTSTSSSLTAQRPLLMAEEDPPVEDEDEDDERGAESSSKKMLNNGGGNEAEGTCTVKEKEHKKDDREGDDGGAREEAMESRRRMEAEVSNSRVTISADVDSRSMVPPLDFTSRFNRREATLLSATDKIVESAFKYCCIAWGVIIAMTWLCLTIVALHAPHTPVPVLCNRETEWSSLINNIKTAITQYQVTVEFELLVSLYNPNRVDIKITSLRGTLSDPDTHSKIGSLTLNPFEADAGSITDFLGTVTIQVDRWGLLDLGNKYRLGTLIFDANVDIDFEIRAYGFSVLSYTVQQHLKPINVTAPHDEKYCHCKLHNSTGEINDKSHSRTFTSILAIADRGAPLLV